jgi:parallel beta-helix repeat protein
MHWTRLAALAVAAANCIVADARSQIRYTITTLADAVPAPAGSLRAALDFANRNALQASPSNRIELTFAAALAGQTVRLQGNLPRLNASWTTLTVEGSSPARRVTIHGNQADAILLVAADGFLAQQIRFSTVPTDTVILFGADGARFSYCEFLDGGEAGVNLIGSRDATLTDCVFENNGRGLFPGLLCHDASDRMRVERCTFRNQPLNSAVALAGVTGVVIQDCAFHDLDNAISAVEVCRDLTIGPGNTFDRVQRVAVLALLPMGLTVKGSVLRGSGAANGNPQIAIDRGTDVAFDGVDVVGGGGHGISITRSQRITLQGCTITDNAGFGLDLRSSSDVLVQDCELRANSRTNTLAQLAAVGLTRAAVLHTMVRNGPGIGVVVQDCHEVTIADGCVVEDHAAAGIVVERGSDVCVGPRDPRAPGRGNAILRNAAEAVNFYGTDGSVLCGGEGASRTQVAGNAGPVIVHGQSTGCRIGPGNDLAGATQGIFVRTPARDTTVTGNVVSGYATHGLSADRADGLVAKGNTFAGQGGTLAGVLLLGVARAELLRNLSFDHDGQGFFAVDCPDLWLGPGNVSARNRLSGFQIECRTAVLRATLMSCASLHSPQGAGFWIGGADARLLHCTGASNQFGVALLGGLLDAESSIFWANARADRYVTTGSAAMRRCLFDANKSQGQFADQLNLTSSAPDYPRFTDLPNGDIHLLPDSPAIDAGSPSPVHGLPAADFEGEQRALRGSNGDLPDLGADEATGTQSGSTSLLADGVLRGRDFEVLQLRLQAGAARGNEAFVLLLSQSGTSPGLRLGDGSWLPLQPDALTILCLTPPLLGTLDAAGDAAIDLPIPNELFVVLGNELTAVFLLPPPTFVSNPVVVRFQR